MNGMLAQPHNGILFGHKEECSLTQATTRMSLGSMPSDIDQIQKATYI